MRASANILRSTEIFPVATEIEILSVLKILGDVYPSHRLSSSAVEVYVRLLADIPAMLLEQAALDHISRSAFFPAIAEMRAAAFNILESADPLPGGYEAWAEVQAEIGRVGHAAIEKIRGGQKVNDPNALLKMGTKRHEEGDYHGAFEYWAKAAELGNTGAHYNLSIL